MQIISNIISIIKLKDLRVEMNIADIETNHLIIRLINSYFSLDNENKDICDIYSNYLLKPQELAKEEKNESSVSLKINDLIDKELCRMFFIVDKINKKDMGCVLIKEKNNEYKEVEIDYYLIKEYKKQNYEIETMKAIIWFSFEQIHKDLVSILVDINDIEKLHMVGELGFVNIDKKNMHFERKNNNFTLFHLYRIDSLDGPDWNLKEMYLCKLENMEEFFKLRAESYNEHVLSGTRKEQYELLGGFIPKTNDSIQILDIGCGTGVELQYIWEKVPNAHITCLDISKDMLNILLKNYEMYRDKITIVSVSYLEWEYPCEEFDLVVSSQTMHHFQEQQKMEVYQNIKNSLKFEGMYIENDFYMDEAGSKQYQQRYKMIMSNLPSNTKPGTFHIDIPFTIEKQLEILNNVGFHSVEVLEKHIKARGSGGIICAIK